MGHWLAVDRCYPPKQKQEAYRYARWRLTELEGRLVHRVEVEAAVVTCPNDHGWDRPQPVESLGETA